MAQIPVKGRDGKPVRYAYLDGGNLQLQFEYYARDENEGEYEVIQTVSPDEFATIANKFGLDPSDDFFQSLSKSQLPKPANLNTFRLFGIKILCTRDMQVSQCMQPLAPHSLIGIR